MKIERQRSHTTNRRGWHFAVTLFCFCSVSEHLPPVDPRPAPGQPPARRQPFPAPNTCVPGQATAISSRVGNSSAQTVGAQAFRTLDFRLFEHKIAIFVRFLPSEPPFSAFRAQNQGFCARRTGKVALGILKLASGIPKVVFLQITAHTSKM